MATRGWSCAPALAVVLLLAACTLGSGSQTPPSDGATSSSPSSGSPAVTSSPGASRAPGSGGAAAPASPRTSPSVPRTSSRVLQLTTTVRIPLAGQTYGRGLVLFGRYAAWVGCAGCERTFTEPTTLYVADLSTRRVRAVATVPKNSLMAPIGGAGTRLAYLMAQTGTRTLQWAIETLDLATGTRSTLTTGVAVQRVGTVPPVATTGDGQVVWQTFAQGPQGASHGPVTAVDLRTGARRTVSRDLPGVLGAMTAAGPVYRAPSAQGAPIDEGPTDAFVLRPGRSRAIVLSDRHDVRDIVADDVTAVWQTNDGPDAATWAAPLDGQGPAREYYAGGTGDRAVGTGFLALVTAGDEPVLLLYPLRDGPVVAVGDVPEEFESIAAEGARLAYLALPPDRGVQPDDKHPITLVVTTVALPGS